MKLKDAATLCNTVFCTLETVHVDYLLQMEMTAVLGDHLLFRNRFNIQHGDQELSRLSSVGEWSYPRGKETISILFYVVGGKPHRERAKD